jgi:predicted AAA+ superfamily ATPase
MLDTAFPYKGVLNESYVAGQLAAARVPLYYWREGSSAEVDFLIDTPGGIVPLEVKSGANKKTPSLRRYEDTFKPPWAIRVTARNFGFAGGIKSVPLYAVFCIPSLL